MCCWCHFQERTLTQKMDAAQKREVTRGGRGELLVTVATALCVCVCVCVCAHKCTWLCSSEGTKPHAISKQRVQFVRVCESVHLTRTEYSTSSPNRPVSLRVYLAFFTLASTGPFSIWCLMARNSLYKGSPAES